MRIFPIEAGLFGLSIPTKIVDKIGEQAIETKLSTLEYFDLWTGTWRKQMYCPSCKLPVLTKEIKCKHCRKILIHSPKPQSTKRKIKNVGEQTYKRVKDGPIVGLIMVVFGFWWPYHMCNTWVNLKPMAVGKFKNIVITWEANPEMYSFSIVATVLGCICGLYYGFTLVFKKNN